MSDYITSELGFDKILDTCYNVFDIVSDQLLVIILPLFFIKLIISFMRGYNIEIMKRSILGLVTYFAFIAMFPLFLKFTFNLPSFFFEGAFLESYSTSVSESKEVALNKIALKNLKEKTIKQELDEKKESSLEWVQSIPDKLRYCLELILILFFWLGFGFHSFVMLAASSIGPIIALLSTQLNIGWGLKTFFGGLTILSTWPLTWYAFSEISYFLTTGSTIGSYVVQILLELIRIAIPIAISYKVMTSNAVSSAVEGVKMGSRVLKSGHNSIMRTASVAGSAASTAKNLSKGTYSRYQNAKANYQSKNGSKSVFKGGSASAYNKFDGETESWNTSLKDKTTSSDFSGSTTTNNSSASAQDRMDSESKRQSTTISSSNPNPLASNSKSGGKEFISNERSATVGNETKNSGNSSNYFENNSNSSTLGSRARAFERQAPVSNGPLRHFSTNSKKIDNGVKKNMINKNREAPISNRPR